MRFVLRQSVSLVSSGASGAPQDWNKAIFKSAFKQA